MIFKSLANRSRWQLVIVALTFISVVIIAVGVLTHNNSDQLTPITNHQAKEDKESSPIFTFAAVGDFGANNNTKSVLSLSKQKADFLIALGDYSYGESSSEKEWCNFVHEEVGQTYPVQLVAGNHDVEGDEGFGQGHFERFASCLPNRMPNIVGDYGINYYFDYKNVARFINISPDLELFGEKIEFSEGSPNYVWLNRVIDEANDSKIKWLVVSMHKNCLTIGVKSCEVGEDLINLLLEKKVDLIFQGHEHGYMRTHQIQLNHLCPGIMAENPDPDCIVEGDSYKKDKGSVIVISGVGGYSLRDIDLSRKDKPYFRDWHGSNISPVHGLSIVDVYNDKLEFRLEAISGSVEDKFTILGDQG
jgi:predicted phosphodiesterase